MTVTPDDQDPGGPDVTAQPDDIRDPLASWGRTARLCTVRLAEAVPAAIPVLTLWVMRH